jgi:L-rhamnose mutarotase
MKRMGLVGKLQADKVDYYVELHADAWPAVLARITECHLQNYSIFLKTMPGGEHWLFSYFEYTGDDFDADMRKMAADPETQRWWAECKPCFESFEDLPPGEVWAPMEEVFFQA